MHFSLSHEGVLAKEYIYSIHIYIYIYIDVEKRIQSSIWQNKGTNKLAETKFVPIKTQHNAKVTQKQTFLFKQVFKQCSNWVYENFGYIRNIFEFEQFVAH